MGDDLFRQPFGLPPSPEGEGKMPTIPQPKAFSFREGGPKGEEAVLRQRAKPFYDTSELMRTLTSAVLPYSLKAHREEDGLRSMHILLALEILGTVAFAISGAIVGLQKRMDIFGVCILGLTTAVGGGVLRDLILNITPPAAFRDPIFAVTAVVVSAVLFIRHPHADIGNMGAVYEKLLLAMDSVGLGLFTVTGIHVAKASGAEANLFLQTFVGVLTGVGGGLLRDVFAGHTPSIFVKHFYACASIIGAWACALLWPVIGESASMFVGAAAIVVLRLLAAHYHWSLPRAE